MQTHVSRHTQADVQHTHRAVFEGRCNHGDTRLGALLAACRWPARLRVPGQMSSRSADTHLVATSIPISDGCQSMCCHAVAAELPSQPNEWPKTTRILLLHLARLILVGVVLED